VHGRNINHIMVSFEYIACVDDQNRWSFIHLFEGQHSTAMASLQVRSRPSNIKNTFTGGTDSLFELNYNNSPEDRGIDFTDLGSNTFKTSYSILN